MYSSVHIRVKACLHMQLQPYCKWMNVGLFTVQGSAVHVANAVTA